MEGILNKDDSNSLLNSINHRSLIEHQERLNLIIGEQELLFVKNFGLKPFKDGNKWCVLLGENIQNGIVGFGDTPYKAILDFNSSMNKK